ncbi:arsenate reductase (glutaredoxin) [Pasteurellaceae bacterium Macca]|nr:arsenate reductase (glutaredoxin) [Pasteurellaceae bacterium Macca]
MSITIYHNPNCSKSRETLALIRRRGIEPKIVEYLNTALDIDTVKNLIEKSGLTPRQAIRTDVPAYGVIDDQTSDEAILAHIVANPSLLNRPFVESDKGVRFCRPPELVNELLP